MIHFLALFCFSRLWFYLHCIYYIACVDRAREIIVKCVHSLCCILVDFTKSLTCAINNIIWHNRSLFLSHGFVACITFLLPIRSLVYFLACFIHHIITLIYLYDHWHYQWRNSVKVASNWVLFINETLLIHSMDTFFIGVFQIRKVLADRSYISRVVSRRFASRVKKGSLLSPNRWQQGRRNVVAWAPCCFVMVITATNQSGVEK